MSFFLEALLENKKFSKNLVDETYRVYVCPEKSLKSLAKKLKDELNTRDLKKFESCKSSAHFSTEKGPLSIVVASYSIDKTHHGVISEGGFNKLRNSAGEIIRKVEAERSKEINIDFISCKKDEIQGFICGLEVGAYKFDGLRELGKFNFYQSSKKINPNVLKEAISFGVSINQARHLVNLPPNVLNPTSYSKEIKKHFDKSKLKVEIFDEKFLRKNKYNLILCVGDASEIPPCIVRLRYRPRGAKGNPIAFVGKGITFDTGGLDLKSAAGMRLMKKDMGGSAALVGLARYIERAAPKKNIDIYLALAENAVDERASRPSDIYEAKNGIKVEIHNTDAEGRLAMASAMLLAQDETGKNAPAKLIDVATLTGAGKVALGQDVTSLFSNNDRLADQILKSATRYGDYCWRMPLYQKYHSMLDSSFADMVNAASGGGGAITAALFLEKFIDKTPWAHLDIFGWTTPHMSSHLQKGGSGQGVMALIGLV